MPTRITGAMLALAALLPLAASALPGAKQLQQPQAESAVLEELLDARVLSEPSRELLKTDGLLEDYGRAPSDAVARLKQRYDAEPTPQRREALVELCSDVAGGLAGTEPERAVAYYLAAAELAFQAGPAGPALNLNQTALLAAYNHSAGQVASLLSDLRRLPMAPAAFTGPWQNYTLRVQADGEGLIDPRYFDTLIAAEYLARKHTSVPRQRRKGYGAALVGHHRATAARTATMPFMPATGLAMAVNATLDYGSADTVELAFHNLEKTGVAALGQRQLPLAADFTAPLLVLFNQIEGTRSAWKGMRHPDDYVDEMGLFQVGPFQPDKIPVVLVHGLVSSPRIWLPALNALHADPLVRERYQLFVFHYPTGFPISYSAGVLRHRLTQLRDYYDPERANPLLHNLLMIGHSMGGILSSMQIRNSGNTLERMLFTRAIDDVQGLDAAQKSALKSLLIYSPIPEIQRVVFISTPHRGSRSASGLRGIIGSMLIDFPDDFLITKPLQPMAELTPYGEEIVSHPPNGIRSLVPNSPPLMAILGQPIRTGVVYHSIIGQKNPRRPTSEGSDGTVAYWSAHLEGAASEKIVFDSHTPMVGNPETIGELRRILYLHAGISVSGSQ